MQLWYLSEILGTVEICIQGKILSLIGEHKNFNCLAPAGCGRRRWLGSFHTLIAILIVGTSLFTASARGGAAQNSAAQSTGQERQPSPKLEDSDSQDPYQPLPQDVGAEGLKEMLLRLQTTARMVQVTAHPDDEDGGMLTLESRGKGVSTLLLTLNRGEGGQNKVGSNLFDVLGVLRTLELLAADRYYGVDQRFTRVADFGFSKTPRKLFRSGAVTISCSATW